jgi:hypothetical protein
MCEHLIETEAIQAAWFFNRANNYVSEPIGPFGTKEAARQAHRILKFTGWTHPHRRWWQRLLSKRRCQPGDSWERRTHRNERSMHAVARLRKADR